MANLHSNEYMRRMGNSGRKKSRASERAAEGVVERISTSHPPIARQEEMTEQQQGTPSSARGGCEQNTHRMRRLGLIAKREAARVTNPLRTACTSTTAIGTAVFNRNRADALRRDATRHSRPAQREQQWITEQTKTARGAFPCTIPTK